MQHSEFSEYLNVHRIFLHRHSFDRSHRFHDYLLITGTYRSNFSPPEMASYLCSVTGNRVFSAPTGPKRASESSKARWYTRTSPHSISPLSFSLSLRLFRRIVAFVSVSPLPSCSPASFFLRSTSSYLHSRLFHSLSLLFSYFFHRHPFLAPSSSSSLLPTLIDLLNQQLRNFQHQKSWRTRKMNDRPRCSNDPSLK